MSTRELDSWIGTHTQTHRVIVYICSPTNSMTTCRPASVLFLIYGYNYIAQVYLSCAVTPNLVEHLGITILFFTLFCDFWFRILNYFATWILLRFCLHMTHRGIFYLGPLPQCCRSVFFVSPGSADPVENRIRLLSTQTDPWKSTFLDIWYFSKYSFFILKCKCV